MGKYMEKVRNIFWNNQESRLRAGWRILLQLMLNICLILVLGSIASNLFSSVIPPDIRGYLLAYPVMLVATMIAIILAGRFIDRRRFIDFGLSLTKHEWWIDFTFGVVLSTIPVLIILLALQGMGWITIEGVFKSKLAGWSIVFPLLIAVINHICVGAFEEIARVYQMRNLFESVWAHLGRWGAALIAISIAALISIVMHLSDLELLPPVFLVYVLLDGLFLGLCYLVTGRAAIAIAMHLLIDLLLLTVFVTNGSTFFDGFVTLFSIRFTNSVSTEFIRTNMDSVIIIGIFIYEIVNILALYAWVRIRYGKFTILDNLAVTSFLQKPVNPE
jgi:membrane protease YdiL (CAAX protease family)